ncbi:DUF6603 domain-containing protein [Falsiroseomonas sp. HC035]|uniref:DUF6603 domain-containing protein n=1 Tax=Falsiroseomonas sp. HC035 TaxID=3390999 RepID=UPI003D322F15
MPAGPHIPGPVSTLARWTRLALDGMRRAAESPALLAHVRRELGLPPGPPPDTPALLDDIRLQEKKLTEAEDAALDDALFEMLNGLGEIRRLAERLLGAGDLGDKAADTVYALCTLLAAETVRAEYPLAHAVLRLLMLGYERLEEAPRLDPVAIFHRLSGKAERDGLRRFGGDDALAGMAAPALLLILRTLAAKTAPGAADVKALPPGAIYLSPGEAGGIAFATGWEPVPPAPDAPASVGEVQDLLARAISASFGGALHVKGKDGPAATVKLAFVISALALDAEDGGPGFLFRAGTLIAEGELDLPKPDGSLGKRKLRLKAKENSAATLLWRTADNTLDPSGDAGPPDVELSVQLDGVPDVPAFRIGTAGKSRLDLRSVAAGGRIGKNGTGLFLKVSDAELVLQPGDAGGLIGDIFGALGAGKLAAKLSAQLLLDAKRGFLVDGAAGLKIRLASGLGAGDAASVAAIRADYIDLELGPGKKGGIGLGIRSAGSFRLGPPALGHFGASLDRFGFDVEFAGKEKGGLKLQPPKGIGVSLDLGLVSGGGYLLLDFDKGEFAGALDLTLCGWIAVKAIVILSTRPPGSTFGEAPPPYAFFALVYARFPGGLELFLRLTLNAVGGMIGLHHGFDEAALLAALPSGAMDDVLFPENPVGDAPRIISTLKTIFPIRRDAMTIGLMAELGWGSDQLSSVRLGIILPFDNWGGDRRTSLDRIILLGRLAIECFRSLPDPIRFSIKVDVVGVIQFSPPQIRLYGQLRDSRLGPIAIQGSAALSFGFGDNAHFLISVGGFHPRYEPKPDWLPAMDRVGATYDIGLVKAWVRGYLAVAAGTLQFGAEFGIRYKFGPISLGASFGLDALIHTSPCFRFEVAVRGAADISFRGRRLLGVSFEGELSGPGAWRLKGHAEAKILFFTVEVSFDERWGDDPAPQPPVIALAELRALLERDLTARENWVVALPSGTPTMLTFAEGPASKAGEIVVHPFAAPGFVQRRLPLGVKLQRLGRAPLEGAPQLGLPTLSLNGAPLPQAETLMEFFPVAEYLDVPENERLTRPGFQRMAAGVQAAGSGGFTCAQPVAVTVEYEEVPLGEAGSLAVAMVPDGLAILDLLADAAAARGDLRRAERYAVPRPDKVRLKAGDWSVAEAGTLAPRATAAPSWAAASPAALRAMGLVPTDALLVETFELGG